MEKSTVARAIVELFVCCGNFLTNFGTNRKF
jgi:hypothetical protein